MTSRRELLCDTVISVLAAEGGRGLTHRAVDRAAGVPLGTTKNYFPTREALLRAAAERMTLLHADAVAALRDTTPADVTPTRVAQLYPALLRRAVLQDPTHLLAMAELYLEAVRRPAVREALGRMVVSNAEASASLHRTAGLPSTTRDAGLLDAYFLGVAVSLLALPADALRATGLDDPDALGLGLFRAAIPSADPSGHGHQPLHPGGDQAGRHGGDRAAARRTRGR